MDLLHRDVRAGRSAAGSLPRRTLVERTGEAQRRECTPYGVYGTLMRACPARVCLDPLFVIGAVEVELNWRVPRAAPVGRLVHVQPDGDDVAGDGVRVLQRLDDQIGVPGGMEGQIGIGHAVPAGLARGFGFGSALAAVEAERRRYRTVIEIRGDEFLPSADQILIVLRVGDDHRLAASFVRKAARDAHVRFGEKEVFLVGGERRTPHSYTSRAKRCASHHPPSIAITPCGDRITPCTRERLPVPY